jgi:hypothetical protein
MTLLRPRCVYAATPVRIVARASEDAHHSRARIDGLQEAVEKALSVQRIDERDSRDRQRGNRRRYRNIPAG